MLLFKIIFRLFGYHYDEGKDYMLGDILSRTGYAYKHDKENEFKIDYLSEYFKPFWDRYYFLKGILYFKKNKTTI